MSRGRPGRKYPTTPKLTEPPLDGSLSLRGCEGDPHAREFHEATLTGLQAPHTGGSPAEDPGFAGYLTRGRNKEPLGTRTTVPHPTSDIPLVFGRGRVPCMSRGRPGRKYPTTPKLTEPPLDGSLSLRGCEGDPHAREFHEATLTGLQAPHTGESPAKDPSRSTTHLRGVGLDEYLAHGRSKNPKVHAPIHPIRNPTHLRSPPGDRRKSRRKPPPATAHGGPPPSPTAPGVAEGLTHHGLTHS